MCLVLVLVISCSSYFCCSRFLFLTFVLFFAIVCLFKYLLVCLIPLITPVVIVPAILFPASVIRLLPRRKSLKTICLLSGSQSKLVFVSVESKSFKLQETQSIIKSIIKSILPFVRQSVRPSIIQSDSLSVSQQSLSQSVSPSVS